eukprot:jgi/Tetstr1/457568/TSEL_044136.t1
MQVVHEKPETRRHMVFNCKVWDELGKHAVLRDRRAEVEQMTTTWQVLHFLEVTHSSPSVPDLTLIVCRLHAAERMVIGAPLGIGVWQSKAPLRPNIRKGHNALSVALKHIEEKLCCFYADPDIVLTDQH